MRFLQGSMLHINKELIQVSSVGARHGLFLIPCDIFAQNSPDAPQSAQLSVDGRSFILEDILQAIKVPNLCSRAS